MDKANYLHLFYPPAKKTTPLLNFLKNKQVRLTSRIFSLLASTVCSLYVDTFLPFLLKKELLIQPVNSGSYALKDKCVGMVLLCVHSDHSKMPRFALTKETPF